MANNLLPAVAPVTRRVRAFFAPVARASAAPTLFDPANAATFNADAPPAPWLDLGWCTNFTRKSATKIAPLLTGAPAMPSSQVRTEVDASVAFDFESWGKLQMALAAGVQQMNVLATQPNASCEWKRRHSYRRACPLQPGSTALSLNVGAAASGFDVGDIIAVDIDYTGQTGFVGAGVSGGFVKSAASIAAGPDYIRRITLNVARIAGIATACSRWLRLSSRARLPQACRSAALPASAIAKAEASSRSGARSSCSMANRATASSSTTHDCRR